MSPWWVRPVQNEPKHSLGKLVVLCSVFSLAAALNLFSAVLKFSDGQGWSGAWRLAIALLSGSLAAKAILEIWRVRRIEPPEEKIG
jgi:hypothetical protein